MRRDKELAQLEDHDEYEFVSPRSSTSGTTASQSVQSTVWSSYESPQNKSMLVERKESDKRIRTYSDHLSESSRNSPRLTDVMLVSSPPPPNTKIAIQPIKYTTKVTAVINHVPTNSDSSDTVFSSDLNHEIDLDLGRNKSTLTHEFRKQDSAPVVKRKAAIMTSGSYTLPRDFTPAAHLDKTVPWSEGSSKHDKTSEASDNNNQVSLQNKKSTIPTVVLRAKYPNATRYVIFDFILCYFCLPSFHKNLNQQSRQPTHTKPSCHAIHRAYMSRYFVMFFSANHVQNRLMT